MTTVSNESLGIQRGVWRWVALGFVSLAVVAAAITVVMPRASGWLGVALLAAIGAVGSIFLFAVWPRAGAKSQDARRVAEAAAAANVAWAVTGAEGILLDCNDAYRRLAGVGNGQMPAPPELALAGETSGGSLFRLARSAQSGRALEETIPVAPGLEVVVAVQPLSQGQAAWWFTPRMSRIDGAGEPKAVSSQRPREKELGVADLFRDAPMGIAVCDAEGAIA